MKSLAIFQCWERLMASFQDSWIFLLLLLTEIKWLELKYRPWFWFLLRWLIKKEKLALVWDKWSRSTGSTVCRKCLVMYKSLNQSPCVLKVGDLRVLLNVFYGLIRMWPCRLMNKITLNQASNVQCQVAILSIHQPGKATTYATLKK